MSFRSIAVACLAASLAAASQHQGTVTFNGLPVPGATVTASQAGAKYTAVTGVEGAYSLPGLPDGLWKIEIRMLGFETVTREIAIAPGAPAALWELKLLPPGRIQQTIQAPAEPDARAPVTEASGEEDLRQYAADGFLINGSLNNAAASPFAQPAAFGNNRVKGKGLYNGGIGVIIDNSALNARPFSLTGRDTPKAAYNRITGTLALGGPLQIPHLFRNGPNFFLGYQWTRNADATSQSALVPGVAERNGIFPNVLRDPLTGAPFPGNAVPHDRISPQARALLTFYLLPNSAGSASYNYQVPLLSPTHQDALQSRFNKVLDSNNQVYGQFAFTSTRADNPNLFGFLDTSRLLGINASANWTRRFRHQWFLNLGYQFSRFTSHVTPYFENRANVSAQAGISGNNQDPMNWGPPNLNFSSGIAALADSQSSFNRNRTSAVSGSLLWNRGAHNITFGGDFRRQQFNYLSQQDARGTFTFTGAATGSDFADFLLGLPATSSIAFGNADKYFRQSVYDAFVTDDWRISGAFTLNAGVRWEYGAPVTELYGRLVNLHAAPGFRSVAQAVARDYPGSLLRPDKRGLAPRVGIAWRPVPGSSLVVRAGYGIYYDSSVYQTIAMQMAQQPPLSKTSRVQTSAANPLTLADGFPASASAGSNTFAVDPNFRPGYAQNWQLSIQRDLPASLQMTATYLGIKGTRAMQQFLPNTWPAGAANPCPACPAGFAYLTSTGNSTRESAQLQLRRRLRSGLTAVLQYTFSKSIDDAAALGGQGSPAQNSARARGTLALATAQNWLDLRAERGLSAFDQRHLLNLQMQYTTGMGLGGGTLMSGWQGALFKDWTVAAEITAGSGLPQTPVYLAPVERTGVTGTIRPQYTGAWLLAAPAGLYLNPAAFTAPPSGQWGNAGRNSIPGPAQFALNASLGRVFRVNDRFNLDLRFDSTNTLNHVTYTAWNTTVNSPQFGSPAAARAMRSIQTTLRLRF